MTLYYYGFRQTRPAPPGRWVLCGPFDSYDLAMSNRTNSKAWDCDLSVVFGADTRAEAEARIDRQNTQ